MKTFIFGAGASVPFFDPQLNTAFLTERICNKAMWDRIIERYKKTFPNRNKAVMPDSYEIMAIIKTIRKFNPKADFEFIAEVIDKISSYGANVFQKDRTLNVLLYVLKGDNSDALPFWSKWTFVPFLFREIIAESILELENNFKCPRYMSLSKLQSDFFEYVCDRDSRDTHDPGVSIMSLNYDDCIFDSLKIKNLGFEFGLQKPIGNYPCQIDKDTFMHTKMVVYFPHGHIKFQFTNLNVSFWDDSNNANSARWNNITPNTVTDDSSDNYNTFIITGKTKDFGLNNMPYAMYYQRLAIDLYKSNEVYIVGYSFNDGHINRLLHSFLHLNTYNKIFIVDKYPYVITSFLPKNDKEGRNKLVDKIKMILDPELLDDTKNDKFPKGISEINSQGYGELFPRVIFYRNGYEAFLNQFEEVLDYYYRREG